MTAKEKLVAEYGENVAYIVKKDTSPQNQVTPLLKARRAVSEPVKVLEPSSVANTVIVSPQIGEQIRQIYNHLAKSGTMPVVTTECDMLMTLLACNFAMAVEIGLKLLINLTAEGKVTHTIF